MRQSYLILEFLKKEGSLDDFRNLIKRVNRYNFWLSCLPFVKEVAVCNNLAFRRVDKSSDIDLFFVLSSDRFYLARLIITILFQLLGARRYHNKIARRFCLSFFVSEKQVDMSEVVLKERDYYFKFWFENLMFLKNDLVLQSRILEENRAWYGKNYFRNEFNVNKFLKRVEANGVACCLERCLKWKVFDRLERFLKRWMLDRALKKSLVQNKESLFGVVIRDQFLKFHMKDIRLEVRDYLDLRESNKS